LFDLVSIVVEIIFVASALGFFITWILLPSRKKVEMGAAGRRMSSPMIPALIAIGTLLALLIVPVSFGAGSGNVRLAGWISAPILSLAYLLIILEYAAQKRQIKALYGQHAALEVESVDVHVASRPGPSHVGHQQAPSAQAATLHPAQMEMMTVECPQCLSHITIPKGSHTITCSRCGLTGSL